MIRRALWALVATLMFTQTSRAELLAGPMVGHVTATSARVWMQFSEAGQVTINAYPVGSTQPVSGVRVDLTGPSPFVCDIPIQNLRPDRAYRIEAKFDGDLLRLPPFSIRTAPVPGDSASFTVAFGSNLAVSPMPAEAANARGPAVARPPKADVPQLPIFPSINITKPRVFFFLGNTGHLPDSLDGFPTTRRAAYRFITDFHSAIRRAPALQPLLTTTPTYGIFSDHDFGPAGAVGTYEFAGESLVAFQKFWPNPDWGTPQDPGCYTTLSLGDVDFFLLDSRTFRDAARPAAAPPNPDAPATAPATRPKTATLFGTAQLDWLKKGLKESRAKFKILAAPCTLWGDAPNRPDADSWSNFPAEQKEFLDWLAIQRIDGILALAGNRAGGEITKFQALRLPYPLYTLATSSLVLPEGARFAVPAENPNRIAPAVSACTFGTVDFGGENNHRFATLRIRDENGKVRSELTLMAAQLKNQRGMNQLTASPHEVPV